MYDQPQALGPLTILAYLQFTGFFSYRMLITILVVTICCLPWRPRFISSVRDGLGRFAKNRTLATRSVQGMRTGLKNTLYRRVQATSNGSILLAFDGRVCAKARYGGGNKIS